MPENLTRQILREHLVDGDLTPGSAISLHIDQALLQDATGTMALMQFEELEVARVKTSRAVQSASCMSRSPPMNPPPCSQTRHGAWAGTFPQSPEGV